MRVEILDNDDRIRCPFNTRFDEIVTHFAIFHTTDNRSNITLILAPKIINKAIPSHQMDYSATECVAKGAFKLKNQLRNQWNGDIIGVSMTLSDIQKIAILDDIRYVIEALFAKRPLKYTTTLIDKHVSGGSVIFPNELLFEDEDENKDAEDEVIEKPTARSEMPTRIIRRQQIPIR